MNPRKKANLLIIFTIAIFAFSSSLVLASFTGDLVDLSTIGLGNMSNNQTANEKLDTVGDGDFTPIAVNKVVVPKNDSNNSSNNSSNGTKPVNNSDASSGF
ncbi:MAG: hypothetical protein ACRCVG_04320 [Methanobacteriaceae archaeon]